MPDKVKPPEGGVLEVSPTLEQPPAAEEASAPEDTSKKRGRKLIGEHRLTGAQRQARYHQKVKEKRNADSVKYDSRLEVTKAEAKHLLELRGLQNPHIIETVYDYLVAAADELDLPKSRFLFAHGILQTLRSYEAKEGLPLAEIADEPVVGQLSNRAELYAIYDIYGWREDAPATDFDEFLYKRRLAKVSPCVAGSYIEPDFDFEECQKNWEEFFPKFNPDTLPPNYTQKQMHQWLDSISDTKEYLEIASRNTGKSHFDLFVLATLHLCCPDARALLVSETNKLSAGFIRKYRSFWEIKPHQETMLQKLFPEYCIPAGSGSKLEFISPMAHLDLIQASATSTSMEAVVAGGRAEIIIFDDPISNLSCGTEEQRKKSVDLYDLIQKLREANGSFSITLGTPWFALQENGDGTWDGDLYAILMKRNEQSADKPLAIRVDPIVTVKREARHKLTPALLRTLTEDDIESYLQPVRLPWKFVRKEIAANPTFALSQNFCIFPKPEDAGLTVTFTEEDIRHRTRPSAFFDAAVSTTVMGLDRAWSTARYADYSCVMSAKILQKDHRVICAITDCRMERWKESQLISNIVEMIDRHRPTAFVLEKDRGWENLIETVRKNLTMRSIPSPRFIAKDIPTGGKNAQSKAKRIKLLELPLSDGRLWLVSSALWNDVVMHQFTKFDGVHTSNSSRKDDSVDVCSLIYETFMPKIMGETDDPTEQEKIDAETEKAIWAEQRRRHYESMYGPGPRAEERAAQKEAPQPERKTDPRLAQLAKCLPSGMRI